MTYPSVESATSGVVLRVFSLQKLFTLKRIQPREEEEEVAKKILLRSICSCNCNCRRRIVSINWTKSRRKEKREKKRKWITVNTPTRKRVNWQANGLPKHTHTHTHIGGGINTLKLGTNRKGRGKRRRHRVWGLLAAAENLIGSLSLSRLGKLIQFEGRIEKPAAAAAQSLTQSKVNRLLYHSPSLLYTLIVSHQSFALICFFSAPSFSFSFSLSRSLSLSLSLSIRTWNVFAACTGATRSADPSLVCFHTSQ